MRQTLVIVLLCLVCVPVLADSAPNFTLTGGTFTVNPCAYQVGQATFAFTGPNVSVSGANPDWINTVSCGGLGIPIGGSFDAWAALDITTFYFAGVVTINGSSTPVAFALPFNWGDWNSPDATLTIPNTIGTTLFITHNFGSPNVHDYFPYGTAPPNAQNGYIVAVLCDPQTFGFCFPLNEVAILSFGPGNWVGTWVYEPDPYGNYDNTSFTLTFHPVPEPASLLLVGTGIAGFVFRRRNVRH